MRLLIVLTPALGAAACATQPTRTPAERSADDAIATRVERALSLDPKIYARHIDVDTERGVVRLSGYVWDSDDLFEARRIATTVPGVKTVISELELKVSGFTGAR